jgi:outer membrane protein OmpA-like peptidoglycan-associated protein
MDAVKTLVEVAADELAAAVAVVPTDLAVYTSTTKSVLDTAIALPESTTAQKNTKASAIKSAVAGLILQSVADANAADAFRAAHSEILRLRVSTISTSNTGILVVALGAFEALSSQVKAYLSQERLLLSSLLVRVQALEAAETKAIDDLLAALEAAEQARIAAEKKAADDLLAAQQAAEDARIAAEKKAADDLLASQAAEAARLAAAKKAADDLLAAQAAEAARLAALTTVAEDARRAAARAAASQPAPAPLALPTSTTTAPSETVTTTKVLNSMVTTQGNVSTTTGVVKFDTTSSKLDEADKKVLRDLVKAVMSKTTSKSKVTLEFTGWSQTSMVGEKADTLSAARALAALEYVKSLGMTNAAIKIVPAEKTKAKASTTSAATISAKWTNPKK